MPSYWTGLLNAGTAAATGALQGDAAAHAAQLQRAKEALARRMMQSREQRDTIGALGTAAERGFILRPRAPTNNVRIPGAPGDLGDFSGPPAPSVPKRPTTTPVAGTDPNDGTVVGELGDYSVVMPSAGLVDKTTRDTAQKTAQAVAARRERLQAYNDALPDKHPNKMTPGLLDMVAGNDQLYNKWAEKTAGLGPIDPTEAHRRNRQYDVEHPLPTRSSPDAEDPAHRRARQNATAVRGQLDATRSDLSAAQHAVPKPPNFFPSPADSTAFVQRRDAAQGNVDRLRTRADSLTGVLDDVTGQMQGRPPAGRSSAAAPGVSGAPSLTYEEMGAELKRNRQRYDALLQAGADPAEAKAAWEKTNQLTMKKYRRR